MEEKERYELIGYCSYRDTETGVIGDNFVELLNEQDKRIKELEEENEKLKKQLALTEKALEFAVVDKCKFENALLSTSLGIAGGKVAVPKKEQYYIEQAKEMFKDE